MPFPLPPTAEQDEIVRRVDALFAVAYQIEARFEKARAHVDRLTQAVLAKAFRGELVPTEHALAEAEGRDYESATELLARIQAGGSTANGALKKGRARKSKPKKSQQR
jgi:type I restriction enzyme S subunit